MPIGWLTVLKALPWADVISNAPKVADGAKKLWQAVPRRAPGEPMPDGGAATASTAVDLGDGANGDLAPIRQQLLSLDAQVAELNEQMRASSELIKALAELNEQLIARVEAHRVRGLYFMWGGIAVGVCAVAALVVALVR